MNQNTQLKRNGWMSPVGGCVSELFPGCVLEVSDGLIVDNASPDPVKKAESPGCCSVSDPDGAVVVLLEVVNAGPIAELWRCNCTSFDPLEDEISVLFLQNVTTKQNRLVRWMMGEHEKQTPCPCFRFRGDEERLTYCFRLFQTESIIVILFFDCCESLFLGKFWVRFRRINQKVKYVPILKSSN